MLKIAQAVSEFSKYMVRYKQNCYIRGIGTIAELGPSTILPIIIVVQSYHNVQECVKQTRNIIFHWYWKCTQIYSGVPPGTYACGKKWFSRSVCAWTYHLGVFTCHVRSRLCNHFITSLGNPAIFTTSSTKYDVNCYSNRITFVKICYFSEQIVCLPKQPRAEGNEILLFDWSIYVERHLASISVTIVRSLRTSYSINRWLNW